MNEYMYLLIVAFFFCMVIAIFASSYIAGRLNGSATIALRKAFANWTVCLKNWNACRWKGKLLKRYLK